MVVGYQCDKAEEVWQVGEDEWAVVNCWGLWFGGVGDGKSGR